MSTHSVRDVNFSLDQSIVKGLSGTPLPRHRRKSRRDEIKSKEFVGEHDLFGEYELEELGNLAMEEALASSVNGGIASNNLTEILGERGFNPSSSPSTPSMPRT